MERESDLVVTSNAGARIDESGGEVRTFMLVQFFSGALDGKIKRVNCEDIVLQRRCVVNKKDERNTGLTVDSVYSEE